MRFVVLLAALAACTMGAEKDLTFDVVFLIDGSKSAQPVFDNFTTFVKDLMAPYNVGMSGARIGLVVVAPNYENQAPPGAQLNSITSQATLIANLAVLKDNYADFDDAGQVLNYNLQVVTSTDFMDPRSGYRSNINNHLLVYITTTTSFNVDPVPTAQTIIQKKQYGIITVGVGHDLDHKKLHSISGGSSCTFVAKDATELHSQIKPIQRHIMHADANSGIYCKKIQ